ncbi:MAG: hypothetical protein KC445_04050 [Anaerolineales bacterium]|nr:hypothetical protein [Anaerolineales bacterium]
MTATVIPTTKLYDTKSDIAITHPQPDAIANLNEIVGKWVKKQGRHWPEEITAEHLVEQLSHHYLPYWVVSGTGSGQWSASIGTNHTKIAICSTCGGKGRAATILNMMEDNAECTSCNGSGRVEKTETLWNNQSGFVETTVDSRVVENYGQEHINLKCGKRNFSVDSSWLSPKEIEKYDIIPPLQTEAGIGQRLAEEITRRKTEDEAHTIASQMGQVKNLQVVNVHTQNIQAYLWFYPLLLGSYEYDDAFWQLQIDGVTGQMWGEVPKSIKSKQWKDRIVILLVVLAIAAIGYGLWALGFNSGWW